MHNKWLLRRKKERGMLELSVSRLSESEDDESVSEESIPQPSLGNHSLSQLLTDEKLDKVLDGFD